MRPASRALAAAALLVAGVVLLAYLPVRDNGFLLLDDDRYVTGNARIKDGLTRDGIAWALTATSEGNWHPLTWISHMADIQLYRFDPAGHHATSALLHAGNAVALLLLLRALSGSLWPSALAAALFGLHPLHVESVAWVAERKDVLSTLFFLLATGAYLRYLRGRSPGWYAALLAAFLLGLASKPMVVTLPLLLLLLDFWPLGRWRRTGREPAPRAAWPILAEKLPLLALAACSSAITLFAQQKSGAVASRSALPLATSLGNAASASVAYLVKTALPAGLSAIYPLIPSRLTGLRVGGSLLALLLLTALACRRWKTRPALAIGWLWFLVALAPVLGIVQVGVQSMADRYTYLPHIGLFAGLVWGAAGMGVARRHRRAPLLAVAAILAVLSSMTWRQSGHWRDTGTLLGHAIAVDRGNYQAWHLLGAYRAGTGDNRSAVAAYREALALNPGHAASRYRLAMTSLGMGDTRAAQEEYLALRSLAPGMAAELSKFIAATSRMQGR